MNFQNCRRLKLKLFVFFLNFRSSVTSLPKSEIADKKQVIFFGVTKIIIIKFHRIPILTFLEKVCF